MVRLAIAVLALGFATSCIAAQDVRVSNPGTLAFNADGRLLRMIGESVDDDRHVHAATLDAHNGEVLHVYNLRPGTSLLSTTLDGSEALIAYAISEKQTQLLLLDTTSGKLELLPPDWYAPEDSDPQARLSGDGRLISIYSEGGAFERAMAVTVYALPQKTLVARQTSPYTDAGGSFGGGITTDGRAIEFDNNRVGSKLVDLKTGRELASFNPGAVRSPDGKWVVELPDQSFAAEDSVPVVGIKDGATGRSLGKLDMVVTEDEEYGGMSGAFCGNAGRFVVADAQTIAAYAIPSGKLIAKFPPETWRDGESGGQGVVACSATGTRVAILSGTRLYVSRCEVGLSVSR